MPYVIKQIGGRIIEPIAGSISNVGIIGNVGQEDYINFGNGVFIAFLQNFSSVYDTITLEKSKEYGLTQNKNTKPITLDISY